VPLWFLLWWLHLVQIKLMKAWAFLCLKNLRGSVRFLPSKF
jgi:hypothetical protein